MKEKLKITDKKGFVYEVTVNHSPHLGFSMAYYNDRIVADCQLGRITQPLSDDDREWEEYEERFSEWRDEINSNLIPACQKHFNNN